MGTNGEKLCTDLDGGKDHVLAHAQVLLLPQSDESVVVALQLLRAVHGLRVRRPEHEDGPGDLALLPAAVGHLPAEHVGVVPHGADLVLGKNLQVAQSGSNGFNTGN